MQRSAAVLACLLAAACAREAPQPVATASSDGPNLNLTVQDRRLLAAAVIALPPQGFTVDSLPDPGSEGARLVGAFCTQCHSAPSPAMHGAVDWPGVARRMWVRIDMLHGELGVRSPTEAERMQVLRYLTGHALQVADHLPAGAGRETFQAMCSRCHALPDPRAHSAADWPTVIQRMEGNMTRMNVSGVSRPQAEAIVGYLRVASRP